LEIQSFPLSIIAQGEAQGTFLIGVDGVLKQEWRGLKVPGHVDEVLKAVKALKKSTASV
jgi:peroxiredoxin Q/BCP